SYAPPEHQIWRFIFLMGLSAMGSPASNLMPNPDRPNRRQQHLYSRSGDCSIISGRSTGQRPRGQQPIFRLAIVDRTTPFPSNIPLITIIDSNITQRRPISNMPCSSPSPPIYTATFSSSRSMGQ
ncbi:hypothetical protein ACLOJK_004776, partial [Asimina triloba]